ncbi:MAG: hypothetical protein WCD89_00825 [Anaerocolumna sp.]
MDEFNITQGRVEINIKSLIIGNDIGIVITGGDQPHVGCVALSICRENLQDENHYSYTTSVLNLLGHKDEIVVRYVAEKVAEGLGKNVVIIGGIHVNDIKTYELDFILNSLDDIVEGIIKSIK